MNKNKQILKELKRMLLSSFPDIIENVILFGSRINGNSNAFSDFDVLLILNIDYDWELENKIIDLCYNIDLKYNIITDVKIISSNELLKPKGQQKYIQNAILNGLYA